MSATNVDRFDRLIDFLRRLHAAKVPHTLTDHRDDAVTVLAFAPGEYWEIDFLADGEIDIERFRSQGVEGGPDSSESLLDQLIAAWSENESAASSNEINSAGASRK
jgi:hypothetical protein